LWGFFKLPLRPPPPPPPPLTQGSTLCTTAAATFKVRDRQRAAHHEHANRYAGPHAQDHLAEQRGHCHQPGLRRDERDANKLTVPELECRDCVGQASDSKGHGGTGRLRSDWVCSVSSEHCWVPAVDTGLHVKRHSVRFFDCVFFYFSFSFSWVSSVWLELLCDLWMRKVVSSGMHPFFLSAFAQSHVKRVHSIANTCTMPHWHLFMTLTRSTPHLFSDSFMTWDTSRARLHPYGMPFVV
jgi:hypothetical protein